MKTAYIFFVVCGCAVAIGFVVLLVGLARQLLRDRWKARLVRKGLLIRHTYLGDSLPESWIDPEYGTRLMGTDGRPFGECLELPYRGRRFVAVASGRWSVQLATEAARTFQIAPRSEPHVFSSHIYEKLPQVKTFDREFDERFMVRAWDRDEMAVLLVPDLRGRILADGRFDRWSVVAEENFVFTKALREGLSKESLYAQADFLLDVLELFPAEFWSAK